MLHIFSDGELAASIITTVFVGLVVAVFFNLRLGWPLVGLVIPGYMAPLLLAQPLLGIFTILEGFFAYFWFIVVTKISEKFGLWQTLFGRDRFFAIILISIMTRLLIDGVFKTEASFFHSFGVVIVALIANYLWRSGFQKGFWMMFTTILITALLIRYGLMEFTNFRLSQINYLYLEPWNTFLESPKIYIIMVATAYMASRLNFFYGLDFGGIIIPALLALQWHDPLRILITIAEAWLIYGISSFMIKKFFANFSILDGRKIVFVFSVGFIYKMLIGYLFYIYIPEYRVLDYYGFGYILSTLIAIKILDLQSGFRTTRALLQVSLTGLLVGILISSTLSIVIPPKESELFTSMESNKNTLIHKELTSSPVYPLETLEGSLSDIAFSNNFHDIAGRIVMREDINDLKIWEHDILENLLLVMKESPQLSSREVEQHSLLKAINTSANAYGYKLVFLKDTRTHKNYLVLQWQDTTFPCRGMYIFNLGSTSSYLINVPHASQESFTLERGVEIFEDLNAAGLFVSETPFHASPTGHLDTESFSKREQSMYKLFTQVLLRKINDDPLMVIEVRGLSNPNYSYLYNKKSIVPPEWALYISFGDGSVKLDEFSDHGLKLWNYLYSKIDQPKLVDGSKNTAGLENEFLNNTLYLNAFSKKESATIWYTYQIREEECWPKNNPRLISLINALDLGQKEGYLLEYLQKNIPTKDIQFPSDIASHINQYNETNNPFRLVQFISELSPLKCFYFIDKTLRKGFILVEDANGKVVGVINLSGKNSQIKTISPLDRKFLNEVLQNKIIQLKGPNL